MISVCWSEAQHKLEFPLITLPFRPNGTSFGSIMAFALGVWYDFTS